MSTIFKSNILREDWLVCLTSLALIVAMLVALSLIGSPSQVYPIGFINMKPYLLGLFVVYSALLIAALVRVRPESPIAFVYREGEGRLIISRVLRNLPIIIAIALFMPAFSAMKSSIPLFNTYDWDEFFITLDIAIHGDDPWKLLQPYLGHPWVTSFLSQVYHLWFMLIYIGPLLVAVFVKNRTLRFRFFVSYLLTWSIVGTALAIIFASVGPCFVGPIQGNEHFDAQMQYLRLANEQYPVAVLEVQQLLLDWHRSGQHGLGRGITAMPSMHVALAFLYVLFAIKISKPLAWLLFLFFMLVLIGSVHLAYHYAVDGYLSVIVTGAIWLATRPIARIAVGESRHEDVSKGPLQPAVS